MDGLLLIYKSNGRHSLVKINHALFGRIITLKRQGIIYRYYRPGLLDNIKYNEEEDNINSEF